MAWDVLFKGKYVRVIYVSAIHVRAIHVRAIHHKIWLKPITYSSEVIGRSAYGLNMYASKSVPEGQAPFSSWSTRSTNPSQSLKKKLSLIRNVNYG